MGRAKDATSPVPFASIRVTNAKQLWRQHESLTSCIPVVIGDGGAAPVQSWCVGGGTHWGLSCICLWLLMGGSVALVLNSSPFFRVSRICSVSVNAHKRKHEMRPSCTTCSSKAEQRCRQENPWSQQQSWPGPSTPFSESLRGCEPMQIERLSSSSSGGRLRSSHTHLALTPLRLEPSVSMPWSTLSCLDEQEIYAIINTSSSKNAFWINKQRLLKEPKGGGGTKHGR